MHKAPGPDGLDARVLKECSTQISPILALIYNDFSWMCQTCGAPNHSVLSLVNNLASFELHNSFSSLSDSASRPSELSAEHTTVSHKNLRYATLKVLNINARSIKAQDKLDPFHAMLD